MSIGIEYDESSDEFEESHECFGLLVQEYKKIGITDFIELGYFVNACIQEEYFLINKLLSEGTDINYTNDMGETPRFLVCKSGKLDAVRYLVEYGADVNFRNNLGETPFLAACMANCLDVAELLVELGADPNAQSNDGLNGLHCLIKEDYRKADVFKLLKLEVKCSTKDKDGNTPFHYIFMSVSKKVQKYGDMHYLDILDYAHDLFVMSTKDVYSLYTKNNDGNIPLHLIDTKFHSNLLEILDSYGLMLFIKDADRKTALDNAKERGLDEIYEKLLKEKEKIKISPESEELLANFQ